jgi:glycine/D-amino acid oxidase-like deaminating enzyme
MQTDVLIIGQGICGTFLSRELERAGLSYVVIDDERPSSASRTAAGLINPMTGRRMVKTWMIDELLPFAQKAYREIGDELEGAFLRQVSVVDFFPTAQMRLAFVERHQEDPQYLRLPEAADDHVWDGAFRYELGYGSIEPCYLVDIQGLLGAARQRMIGQGLLREEKFELGELVVGKPVAEGLMAEKIVKGHPAGDFSIRYRDIEARWIVFCDGVESFQISYFSRLPFAPNKGEVLIVDAPELAGEIELARGVSALTVFKKGMSIIPWKEGLYWVGSSYEWSFADVGPTKAFKERTEAILRDWLNVPFRTVEHFASVRPATLERRPFVGLHPLYPAVGILNGMGTKGCSLAPYFARQLAELLVSGIPVRADADIGRFSKVLGRR